MKGKVIQGKGLGLDISVHNWNFSLFILEVYLYKCTKTYGPRMFIKASFVILSNYSSLLFS